MNRRSTRHPSTRTASSERLFRLDAAGAVVGLLVFRHDPPGVVALASEIAGVPIHVPSELVAVVEVRAALGARTDGRLHGEALAVAHGRRRTLRDGRGNSAREATVPLEQLERSIDRQG